MVNFSFWLRNPTRVLARVRYWIYEKWNPDKPWLCPGTIARLESVLKPQMSGVEFGSGRSTYWLAQHLKHLISIEHHQGWFESVRKQIKISNIRNVDLRFIPLDHPLDESEHNSYDPLPAYVRWLSLSHDDTLDFVLVDGHYRTTCIRCAIPKIKQGGYLVVDDTQMWDSNGGPPVPADWNCIDSSTNGLKTTKIWKRV